jgi:hypothetical protein
MHSYHCKGLTEDENKFAGTCVEAMEKQKQLKALGETSGTLGSDNSRASSTADASKDLPDYDDPDVSLGKVFVQ